MHRQTRFFWFSALLIVLAGVVGTLIPFQPIRLSASQVTEVAFANTHQPNKPYTALHVTNSKDEHIITQVVHWMSQSALIATNPSQPYLKYHPGAGIQAQIVIGNIHSRHYIWLIPLQNHEIFVLSTEAHRPSLLLASKPLYNWLMNLQSQSS